MDQQEMSAGVTAKLGASPEGAWQLTLHEPDREPLSLPAHIEVCNNAFCHCCEVTVVAARPQGALRLRLDVLAADLAEPRSESSDADQRVAEAIVNDLDEADWDRLQASFFSTKARAIERLDPSGAVAPFDFDDIEGNGAMVCFDEVFPYALQHHFELGDRQLTALEQVCVRPSCRCDEALVDIIDSGPDGVDEVALTLVVDGRGRWSAPEAASQPLGRKWSAVRRALLAKHPRYVEVVTKRRDLLRAVYLNSVRELRPELVAPEPVSSPTKVGRNAPCPCGSGRKYKRCCGA